MSLIHHGCRCVVFDSMVIHPSVINLNHILYRILATSLLHFGDEVLIEKLGRVRHHLDLTIMIHLLLLPSIDNVNFECIFAVSTLLLHDQACGRMILFRCHSSNLTS